MQNNQVRQVETRMDRNMIMDSSSNKSMPNKHKLLHTDNNTDTNKHKVHTNKVMLNKAMLLTVLLTANNNNTQDMVKVNKECKVSYHLQEKSKCHTMELLHNHNLTDQPDRRIPRKMLRQGKYLWEV